MLGFRSAGTVWQGQTPLLGGTGATRAPKLEPIKYFKRYRMEFDLRQSSPMPSLPDGYFFLPYDDCLIDRHAAVKAEAFAGTIDSELFPSLATSEGCLALMRAIRVRPNFIPEATWLIARGYEYCGTVQGLCERKGIGAIQNVGVPPSERGQGLGAALVLRALAGFREAGLRVAQLEVTVQNEAAVRLYKRLGFRCVKTVYKAVETPLLIVGGW